MPSAQLGLTNDCKALTYGELLDLPALMTPREAARVAGSSDRHVRRMAEAGKIGYVMLGPNTMRIRTDSLLSYLGLSGTVEAMAQARAADEYRARLSEALGGMAQAFLLD